MESTITQERIQKYFEITGQALEKAKIAPPTKTPLHEAAKDYKDLAQRYYDDAKHFQSEGNLVLAYGALNYAHAWLDAGARIGLFDVDHDDRLFTVDGKEEKKSEKETATQQEQHQPIIF